LSLKGQLLEMVFQKSGGGQQTVEIWQDQLLVG